MLSAHSPFPTQLHCLRRALDEEVALPENQQGSWVEAEVFYQMLRLLIDSVAPNTIVETGVGL